MRLAYSTVASNSSGACRSGVSHWTQSYTFDGFGNLTAKNTNGAVTNYPVDPLTNRISNGNAGSAGMYDASGNMTGAPGAILQYDSMNRVFTANVNGAMQYYVNGSNNRRIMTTHSDGSVDYTLYGTKGERLGVYRIGADQRSGNIAQFVARSTEAWFGNRRMSGPRHMDQLGTPGTGYYPFGEARSSDTGVFATYETDRFTGLNDAVNRWYPAGWGRFGSADPYKASAGASNPGSWNRYSYVQGDPVNFLDPNGTCGTPAISYTKDDGTIVVSVAIPCDYQLFVEDVYGALVSPKVQDRAALADERPFFTRSQMADYAAALGDQVKNGLSDCDAMASYIDAAGNGRTAQQLEYAIGIFVPQDAKTVEAGIPSTVPSQSIGYVSSTSGFAAEYQNTNGDTSNQTHHFAAFFEFGFQIWSDRRIWFRYRLRSLRGVQRQVGFQPRRRESCGCSWFTGEPPSAGNDPTKPARLSHSVHNMQTLTIYVSTKDRGESLR